MSPIAITLDGDYGYVVLAATSTFIMNLVHGINTGKYRKAAKIAYPAAYADNKLAETDVKAYQFNCAQRAHANFIENQTSTVAALLLAGIQYPIAAAVLGAGWTVSRYAYMVGYCQADISKKGTGRYYGITHSLFQLGLFGLAGTVGYKLITSA